MKIVKLLILFVALAAVLPMFSHAEVYVWVDEYGKKHYSDKPPATPDQNVSTINIKEEENATSVNKDNSAGLAVSIRQAQFAISAFSPYWESENFESQPIGRYFFGKACSSATAMVLPEAKNRKHGLFPSDIDLAAQVVSGFNHHDIYAVFLTNNIGASHLPGHFSVKVRMTELALDSCSRRNASNITSSMLDSLKPAAFKRHRPAAFKRHRIKTVLHWDILDSDANVVFSASTRIGVDRWQQDDSIIGVYREVFRQGIGELLKLEGFQTLLVSSPDINHGKKLAESESSAWHSHLTEKFNAVVNYKKHAEFTSIFPIVGEIKHAVAEYYISYGKWPQYLSDIRYSEAGALESIPILRGVSIKGGREIHLLLSQEFSEDASITFIPIDRQSLISWSCLTTVPKKYMPQGLNCSHYKKSD